MGYGTDISDEEWAILAPFLEPKQKGRPRKPSGHLEKPLIMRKWGY